MTAGSGPALFALEATREFGERVASALGVPLGRHIERSFEDGEHKTRPLESVRGRDVYVVQSLHGGPDESPNDKLCRLLFFLGALRDAGAGRVTAAVPYLCYARKDRKTKPRDPVTTRYLAGLFEAVDPDRVVTLEVHNLAAFQNAFRLRTEHLDTRRLFARHFGGLLDAGTPVAVVSPDAGGVKRADAFRRALAVETGREVGKAFMEKYRSRGKVSGETLVGDVEGRACVILDDLIGTGTTMARAADALRDAEAVAVYAAAAHGLFVEGAAEVVVDPAVDRFVVTDSVPPFRLDPALVEDRVTVLDAAGLFAEAIRRLHGNGSLVELLEPEDEEV